MYVQKNNRYYIIAVPIMLSYTYDFKIKLLFKLL